MIPYRTAGLALIACSLLVRCASAPTPAVEIEAPVPPQYASVPRFEKGGDIEAPKAIRRVEPMAPRHLIGNGPRRIRATVEAADGRVPVYCGDPEVAWNFETKYANDGVY